MRIKRPLVNRLGIAKPTSLEHDWLAAPYHFFNTLSIQASDILSDGG